MSLSKPNRVKKMNNDKPNRTEFETEYRKEFESVRGYPISAEEMVSIREGEFYGSDRSFLNGNWSGWQKCHEVCVKTVTAERDGLSDDVLRLESIGRGQRNTIDIIQQQVERLQSELNKARELLNVSYQLLGLNNALVSYRQHMTDIDQFTNAHQPAPAEKEPECSDCNGSLRATYFDNEFHLPVDEDCRICTLAEKNNIERPDNCSAGYSDSNCDCLWCRG